MYNGVFMKSYVDFIEDYLGLESDVQAIDILPYLFMSKYSLKEMITMPTIFQHIGLVSNFDHKDKIYLRSDNFPDDETPIILDDMYLFNETYTTQKHI